MFQKQTSRDLRQTLLPERPFQTDYDNYPRVKEKMMQKLNSGSVSMNKQLDRRYQKKPNYFEDIPSTIASTKVASALFDKIGGKSKSINYTMMSNY
jgi:hypothetical protein